MTLPVISCPNRQFGDRKTESPPAELSNEAEEKFVPKTLLFLGWKKKNI
jgi:hypothetical protein